MFELCEEAGAAALGWFIAGDLRVEFKLHRRDPVSWVSSAVVKVPVMPPLPFAVSLDALIFALRWKRFAHTRSIGVLKNDTVPTALEFSPAGFLGLPPLSPFSLAAAAFRGDFFWPSTFPTLKGFLQLGQITMPLYR
ncbi:MAG: hypothetical protein ACXW3Z_04250 [Limisphaerales bacterium]